MKSLEYILSHPNEIFDTKDLMNAFRVSRQSVAHWVATEKIDYLAKRKGIFIFSGNSVKKFIQDNKSDGRFKSLKEIVENYKLPQER